MPVTCQAPKLWKSRNPTLFSSQEKSTEGRSVLGKPNVYQGPITPETRPFISLFNLMVLRERQNNFLRSLFFNEDFYVIVIFIVYHFVL